ncbi:hypothetical protein DL240_18720 [Lujinxingia litoralis]|uniref:Uncharacterized protein n=1 Tax=Lujinxingia litoralis TaxID=2211119 RepID=A0A328C6K8_9DELT|nr:hypothetical protein [Lujinxingia litoralis]RAL20144.1 hypothetical protein DL240_18720 [Lujinxingia litoralis]
MQPFHVDEFDLEVLFQEVSDLDLGCEQRCSRVSRTMAFFLLEGLGKLEGFHFVESVKGLRFSSMHDLREIDAFHGLTTIEQGISIYENWGLETIEPFASLEHVGFAVGFENNYKLKDLRLLANVRQIGEIGGSYEQGLYLSSNKGLKDMTGLESLERIGGRFRISYETGLESMRGLESLKEVDTLRINYAVELSSLEGLENLQRVNEVLSIENSPKLRRCEVEALVAQLEEPPERVLLSGLSEAPCD